MAKNKTKTKIKHTKSGKIKLITTTTMDPCQYTFAHTQAWCGHPACRTS